MNVDRERRELQGLRSRIHSVFQSRTQSPDVPTNVHTGTLVQGLYNWFNSNVDYQSQHFITVSHIKASQGSKFDIKQACLKFQVYGVLFIFMREDEGNISQGCLHPQLLGFDASLPLIILVRSPCRLQPFEQLPPTDWASTKYWIPTPV